MTARRAPSDIVRASGPRAALAIVVMAACAPNAPRTIAPVPAVTPGFYVVPVSADAGADASAATRRARLLEDRRKRTDLDGDGRSDIVVGELGRDTGADSIHVFLGATEIRFDKKAQPPFDPSIAYAGDVDGDGRGDVVWGAPFENDEHGRIHVLRSQGEPDVIDAEPSFGLLGMLVAAAGDIDGDGFDDVLASTSESGVAIFYGSAGGLGSRPEAWLRAEDGVELNVGALTGVGDVNSDGFDDVLVSLNGDNPRGRVRLYLGARTHLSDRPALVFDGADEGGFFGRALAGRCDVNGDGIADFIVGAHGLDDYRGAAFAFHGHPDGPKLDPDAELRADVAISGYFASYIACAGDVNHDGFDDVIVGAWGDAKSAGRAFLFLGSADGLSSAPSAVLEPPTLEGRPGFGNGVAGTGDVDGDGFDDVAVAAPYLDGGRVYLYRGGAGGLEPTAARVLEGRQGKDVFGSLARW